MRLRRVIAVKKWKELVIYFATNSKFRPTIGRDCSRVLVYGAPIMIKDETYLDLMHKNAQLINYCFRIATVTQSKKINCM